MLPLLTTLSRDFRREEEECQLLTDFMLQLFTELDPQRRAQGVSGLQGSAKSKLLDRAAKNPSAGLQTVRTTMQS